MSGNGYDRVINIENAVVSFREDIALRGVTVQIKPGEFVGVVGPNGAGKTTLLTIINGMGKLIQGQACVLGQPVKNHNGNNLRRKVGYVAQVQNIDPRMPLNVRETVMIGRYGLLGWFRKPEKRDWEIVDTVLELVGMDHLASRPIGHLSGGEQQRAAIARCLAQEPAILLLDEPTASLDWKAKTDILELVRRVHDARQLTTLIVTHDLHALPMACDRVILMKDGMIWEEGRPRELLTDNKLSRLYDLPLSEVQRRRREAVAAG